MPSACTIASTRVRIAASRPVGVLIAVRSEKTDIQVVKGVRPERVVCVGRERVIVEVRIGVGPEQRTKPADHDDRAAMPPKPAVMVVMPFLACEPAFKSCVRQY